MKKVRLAKNEKRIENALIRSEYVKVTGRELEEISESLTLRKKDITMTIRVNSDDIKQIKRKADKLGVKYQTLISEVLHQVAEQ